MKKRTEAGMKMLDKVDDFHTRYLSTLNSNKLYKLLKAEYDILISGIKAYAAGTMGTTTGATEIKNQYEDEWVDETMSLSAALRLLLKRHTDDTWKSRSNEFGHRRSELEKMREVEQVAYGRNLVTVAQDAAIAPVLTSHDITAAMITAYSSLVDKLEGAMPGARAAIAGRGTNIDSLDSAVAEAKVYVREQLTRGIEQFSKTGPDMVAEFKRIIKTDDIGGRSREEEPAPPAS